MIGNTRPPTSPGSAVLAYNGQVFDNIHVGIRGESTQTSRRRAGRSRCRANHDIQIGGAVEPVDEFAMNADWSDNSHGRPLLAWDCLRETRASSTKQVFPVRTQRNATFQGMYTYLDIFDGTWRDREGYSDKQFFKAGHGAFDATRPLVEGRFEKKNPDDADFSGIAAFLNGVDLTGNGAGQLPAGDSADIPEMINYAVATADRPAHRLEQQELLPQPGPRYRSLDDHPLGPRPHVRKHVLRGDQPVRHPGRAG